MDKGRVETFSDGVFAIAITLLVLTIAVPAPKDYANLASHLVHRWPSLAAYVVSFLVIGIMWLNHHTIFTHLSHIDRAFFYRNLLLLLTVVFIPYPTAVFGEALSKGQGANTAAVFYSVSMTVNACAWAALWLYASLDRRLLKPDFPEAQRRVATILFVAGVLAYAVSIGLAFVNAYLCLAFQAGLAVYYALDPIARRVAREQVSST
jgi:TMEM175 potassium channel family protein